MTLNDYANEINQINEEKGWNEPDRTPDRWAALAHTEISEYYEEYRNGHGPYDIYCVDAGRIRPFNEIGHTGLKPEGQAIEMADLLIRTLHWFAQHNLDPDVIMRVKLDYNKTRPYRHGGKKA